jgi:3D-(3,5/4)-trihydroxycyclohexane-1,2-dione acylhydrolase (decyclizing)
VLTASGGLPGELVGGWRCRAAGAPSMDVEYGFSCMGYELAGAWGAAIGRRGAPGVVTTLLGDGSYLMLNSELFSAAFAGHGFVAVVCDNDGYAVIDRLQRGQGGAPFNNMYPECRSTHTDPPRVDFASHAAALGCAVLVADDLGRFRAAYAAARDHAREGRPAVIVIKTHPSVWTDAGAWWEVGVPEIAHRAEITASRQDLVQGKTSQVRYLLAEPARDQRG